MFLQYVLGWLQVWEHSFLQEELKGKRFALPNAEIMIHQPSGGAQGQATEIKIVADHILQMQERN